MRCNLISYVRLFHVQLVVQNKYERTDYHNRTVTTLEFKCTISMVMVGYVKWLLQYTSMWSSEKRFVFFIYFFDKTMFVFRQKKRFRLTIDSTHRFVGFISLIDVCLTNVRMVLNEREHLILSKHTGFVIFYSRLKMN